MTSPRLTRLLIEAMAKHLPPSASTLRLVDVGGAAQEVLASMRADLEIIPIDQDVPVWPVEAESIDGIVAYEGDLQAEFLAQAHRALRPGGRLVIVQARGVVDGVSVSTLENSGYTRILVETAVECPLPTGVLMRGEKPHTTADTLARVQVAAAQDDDSLDWAQYRGKYVHLLIIQTPNKPAWALKPDEPIQWQAITANGALLAFSSLPKAVGFMQPAVLAGWVSGVNKVAKFSKTTAAAWSLPIMLNPDLDSLRGAAVGTAAMDPTTAETPDE